MTGQMLKEDMPGNQQRAFRPLQESQGAPCRTYPCHPAGTTPGIRLMRTIFNPEAPTGEGKVHLKPSLIDGHYLYSPFRCKDLVSACEFIAN